jgi:hypothetical protein
MREVQNIIGNYWTTYEIVELLRRYSICDPYYKFYDRIIFIISESLNNKLDERDTKNIRRNLL